MTFLPLQNQMVNIITTTMAAKRNVSLHVGAVTHSLLPFEKNYKNTFWLLGLVMTDSTYM